MAAPKRLIFFATLLFLSFFTHAAPASNIRLSYPNIQSFHFNDYALGLYSPIRRFDRDFERADVDRLYRVLEQTPFSSPYLVLPNSGLVKNQGNNLVTGYDLWALSRQNPQQGFYLFKARLGNGKEPAGTTFTIPIDVMYAGAYVDYHVFMTNGNYEPVFYFTMPLPPFEGQLPGLLKAVTGLTAGQGTIFGDTFDAQIAFRPANDREFGAHSLWYTDFSNAYFDLSHKESQGPVASYLMVFSGPKGPVCYLDFVKKIIGKTGTFVFTQNTKAAVVDGISVPHCTIPSVLGANDQNALQRYLAFGQNPAPASSELFSCSLGGQNPAADNACFAETIEAKNGGLSLNVGYYGGGRESSQLIAISPSHSGVRAA